MPGDTPASPALGPDGFPKPGRTPPNDASQSAADPQAAADAHPAPAAKRVPVVRDLSGRPLSEVYDVQWPKEVDGVEIRQVEIKRLSTGQIGDFVDLVRSSPNGGDMRFPLFYRMDGAQITDDEWGALDPDDTDALSERGERFLPARLRSGRTSGPSSPTDTVSSDSSSDASQASA